tara:strand:+ start:2387 stop:3076 length:690 start_codon:yes stop_codon:yes gene_type:complete
MSNTKRFEKKTKRDTEDRELRRLYTKLRKIYKAQRELGWIELDKPIYLGYAKGFVLRDDISRRKDAQVFEDILKHINTFVTCKNKDFMAKPWNSKKKEPIPHTLSTLSKKVYNKLPTNQQKHFYHYYSHKKKEWVYKFTNDYYFVPKIEKNYAYKVREHDADLDAQEAEIDNYIQNNNLWPKIGKVMGWKTHNDGWGYEGKEKIMKDKKRSDLRDVLGEIDQKIHRIKI